MTYSLFIDDERLPPVDDKAWRIARNLAEVASTLAVFGPPKFISFDHDLGANELTGYDIAKKLVAGDLGELDGTAFEEGLPDDFSFYVHSQNPVGARNIRSLLDNYLKYRLLG